MVLVLAGPPRAAVAKSVLDQNPQFSLPWLPSIDGWCGLWLDLLGHLVWLWFKFFKASVPSFVSFLVTVNKYLTGSHLRAEVFIHSGFQFRRDTVYLSWWGSLGAGVTVPSVWKDRLDKLYNLNTHHSDRSPKDSTTSPKRAPPAGGHFTFNYNVQWLSSDTALEFPRCNVCVCACVTG